jgi:hypothetical protein
MKAIKRLVCVTMAALLVSAAATCLADDTKTPAKPYPLKTCLVTGEKLGGMGEAYTFTYKGQEIKLCCKGCVKEFNKNPAKFIKKMQEEAKNAK